MTTSPPTFPGIRTSMIDPNGTLWVSNSDLEAVAACSTKALMRHGFGWATRENHYAAECGEAMHEGQAVYYKTGDAGKALETFKTLWEPMAQEIDPEGPLSRLSLDNVADIYEEWLASHPIKDGVLYNRTGLGLFQLHPELVEVSMQMPLDDRCVFCGEGQHPTKGHDHTYVPSIIVYGRLDAIVTHLETGNWLVNDHKSTGKIDWKFIRKFRLGSQMSTYVHVGQQYTDKEVVGAIITAVELSKLPGSQRKCSTHGLPYIECRSQHAKFETFTVDRSPELLERWRKGAIFQAQKMRDLLTKYPTLHGISRVQMQGMFGNDACVWCDFADWCAADRPVDTVPALFDWSPWIAFDEKTGARLSSRDPRHPKNAGRK